MIILLRIILRVINIFGVYGIPESILMDGKLEVKNLLVYF